MPASKRGAMWALTQPIRFRIWELLREGPSTASRLAERLGESRGSASYHLRVLARAGAIVDDETLGTRRERWWRRPDSLFLSAPGDVEEQLIYERMLAVFFARDEEVRHRFLVGRPSPDWRRAASVGNWYISLTPAEADSLRRVLFAHVDELRRRAPPADGDQALVSISVLPVLDEVAVEPVGQ